MLTDHMEAVAQKPSPGSMPARSTLARCRLLFERGDYLGAASAAFDVLALDSAHLGALELYARAQWRLGDFVGVLGTLRRLETLNPYEPSYFLMQGDALRLIGRHTEARSAYARCESCSDESVRLEAARNRLEIEALLGVEAGVGALWPTQGVSEFLPDSQELWLLGENATGKGAFGLAAAPARPS